MRVVPGRWHPAPTVTLVSVDLSTPTDLPAGFRAALDGLSAVDLRPELVIRELPAPQRLAPFAVALHATAVRGEDELAEGRLVVLHDPDGSFTPEAAALHRGEAWPPG